MDTTGKQTTETLDFVEFIKKYFTSYEVDGNNFTFLEKLGLWANRNPKFNGMQDGWHIDRGILISGPVGAGKDEIFKLLRRYISYLRSPYGFSSKVVWKFASEFTKDKTGYMAFDQENTGNVYYEELALTDNQGNPTREMVSHYGNRLLIGAEIITIRHKLFLETAYQTHFSTNLIEDDLEKVYGERCMSRLYEMCNFMFLQGKDRRGKVAPVFTKNKMMPSAPPPRQITVDEERENIKILEQHYIDFLQSKTPSTSLALVYNMLMAYGVQVSTEEEMRSLMDSVEFGYVSDDVTLARKSAREKEDAKRVKIWELSRKMAVELFFQKMKDHGAKSIFQEVDVRVDAIIRPIVMEKKETTGSAQSQPQPMNGANAGNLK
jgi:hypothetical protein